MSLRTTSTTRSLTIIWCFSVLILILHQFKNLIRQDLILQDLPDCVAHLSLLDPVAAPAILFRSLDGGVQSNGQLLIFFEIIVQRPPGAGIQQFWIGHAGWVLHLVGKFNDSRQVLLVFLGPALTLLDQGIKQL